MGSKNTGNYRICRQQIGHGGTRAVLSEQKNELECKTLIIVFLRNQDGIIILSRR